MRPALPLILTVVLATSCGSGGTTEGPVMPELAPGTITDTTPDGFQATLRTFRGRPLVVNYWASWCDPCVEELPRFVAAARAYGDEVAFLGVDVEDDPAGAERFIARFGIRYPSLGDPKGDIKRAQRIVGLPTTQFFRADGELAFVHAGEITAAQLTDRIEELIRVGTPATPPG